MDIGSFVLDSDGVRWATDLGSEITYGIELRKMDLWNWKQNSDRWKIFRLNSLGIIHGHRRSVADSIWHCKIVAFSDDPATVFDR